MIDRLSRPYNSTETEGRVYELWEKGGFFNPDKLPGERSKTFTIVMPPPNVTGSLHAGHALFLTIQDIFTRFARMRGEKTLWLPGTDHAAIATQAKVEKILYDKNGETRQGLGREKFLETVNKYAAESQNTILKQMRKMGSSCDWSRLAYTLDERRVKAVNEAFKRLYNLGLIYRGKRTVNWDPKLQTTVSDDEIEWKEERVPLYYLKYGPFTIATARPETKFGDKYIVVHPNDRRYEKYKHEQKIELEWINGPVTTTVIKDEAVDMEFGTGAMTITPWHDNADFEIANKYSLDFEQIIDDNGKLLPIGGEFAGQHIKKARPLIVEKLKTKGLIEKIDENYIHKIATNSRGGGIIEPQIKEQWFVAVNKEFSIPYSEIAGIESGQKVTLKQVMRHVVETGQIKFIPERFVKNYYHWIDNLRDWCISRQIWFGHRIPVWYHESRCVPKPGKEERLADCKTLVVSESKPKCEFCDAEFIQDQDTLDTWFSSGLWTFSTLGWPEETGDLRTFHPTQVLETAYEILFFWVARMILMTTTLVGQIPFEKVYFHGLVRDEERKKLSKSKGDSADPLDLIEKYGTDALRFALIFNTSPGMDSILSEEKIKGMKHFANKIWNAARFVISNTEDFDPTSKTELTIEDEAVLKEFDILTEEVTADMEDYKFYLTAEKLYHYFWHTFADILIEKSKKKLFDGTQQEKQSSQRMLFEILEGSLKLLHPFMPFITEELWSMLPNRKNLLIVETWPA